MRKLIFALFVVMWLFVAVGVASAQTATPPPTVTPTVTATPAPGFWIGEYQQFVFSGSSASRHWEYSGVLGEIAQPDYITNSLAGFVIRVNQAVAPSGEVKLQYYNWPATHLQIGVARLDTYSGQIVCIDHNVYPAGTPGWGSACGWAGLTRIQSSSNLAIYNGRPLPMGIGFEYLFGPGTVDYDIEIAPIWYGVEIIPTPTPTPTPTLTPTPECEWQQYQQAISPELFADNTFMYPAGAVNIRVMFAGTVVLTYPDLSNDTFYEGMYQELDVIAHPQGSTFVCYEYDQMDQEDDCQTGQWQYLPGSCYDYGTGTDWTSFANGDDMVGFGKTGQSCWTVELAEFSTGGLALSVYLDTLGIDVPDIGWQASTLRTCLDEWEFSRLQIGNYDFMDFVYTLLGMFVLIVIGLIIRR